MSIRDLTQKYKRQKSRQAVNAAIREELPGGAELLDLASKFERLRLDAKNGRKFADDELAFVEAVCADLQRLRDAFGNEIARRYDLTPKPLTEPAL